MSIRERIPARVAGIGNTWNCRKVIALNQSTLHNLHYNLFCYKSLYLLNSVQYIFSLNGKKDRHPTHKIIESDTVIPWISCKD